MRIGSFYITPNERKRYTIEYSDWLDNGETILTKAFTVQDVTSPPLVVDGDLIDISGTPISFYVSGGVDQNQYDVIVKITTSNSQTKEDRIIYNVKVS